MSEQIRRCVGSIIFVPDRRRFGDLYVRIRTIIRLFLILAQKNYNPQIQMFDGF